MYEFISSKHLQIYLTNTKGINNKSYYNTLEQLSTYSI